MDADDLRDYEDQLPSLHPTSSADLGSYACFLQSMPDYFRHDPRGVHQLYTAYTDILSDIVHVIVPWYPIPCPISCTISHRLDFFHPWIRKLREGTRNPRGNNQSSGQNIEFPLGGFDEPSHQGGQSTNLPWEPVAFVIPDRSGSISAISNPVCGDITISAIASGRALAALDDTLAFACSP